MTPEVFAAIGALIDRYGLPLAILGGLLWLLLTRRVVLGSEATYIEARRLEEREGRIAAEATVKVLTEAVDKLGDGMGTLSATIVDAVDRALLEDRTRARR